MSDQPNPNKDLSEISHLFLSSIRQKAGNGAPPPRRKPPGHRDHITVDLTPEEYAQVFSAGDDLSSLPADERPVAVPEITAVIATHLNGRQFDRVKEYARHLTSPGQRIGLIEVDASEFRVIRFDSGRSEPQPEPSPTEAFDARRMIETLNELSADVDRWLLILPAPRAPEARTILREVTRWVLLCTCDHDGVVSCYRTLKGLTDLWPAASGIAKPRLSLAPLDAVDDAHAERIHTKLSSVCRQFLAWPLEAEPCVRPVIHSAEQLVLCCRPTHDKTQVAAAPQWQIMSDFIARSKLAPPTQVTATETNVQPAEKFRAAATSAKRFVADVIVPGTTSAQPAPAHAVAPAAASINSSDSEVLDLPGDASESSILSAVLRHRAAELIECPIAPPNCSSAKLAVARDHRVVLLAVARQGLAELRSIGEAYRWLNENRALITMAMPQLSIDAKQTPQLSLLIDRADSSAATLEPILQSGKVTVQTYRTLRWSGRTGLLLEAA